jgi:hypothetical protein
MKLAVGAWILLVMLNAGCANSSLDKKITFELTALRVSVILDKVSKATGVQHGLDEVFRKEVLVLKVKDVSARELTDQMAIALDGEWISKDGKRILTRTPALQVKLKAQIKAKKIEMFSRSLKSDAYQRRAIMRAHDAPPKNELGIDAELKRLEEIRLEHREILYKLGKEAAPLIDVEQMIEIPARGFRVWSEKPVGFQEKLSPEFGKVREKYQGRIAQLSAESKQIAERIKPKIQKGDKAFSVRLWLNSTFGAHEMNPSPMQIVALDSYFVLLAGQTPTRLGVSVNQFMSDHPGFMAYSPAKYREAAKPFLSFELKNPDEPVPVSPMMRAVNELYPMYLEQGAVSPERQKELKQVIRNQFSDPLERDPLLVRAVNVVAALAEDQQKNVVANVPDSLCGPKYWFGLPEKITRIDAQLELLTTGMVWANKDGWMVLKSQVPELTGSRVDREQWQALMDEFRKTGYFDPQSGDDFIQKNSNIGVFSPGSVGHETNLLPRSVRNDFWNSLTKSNRDALSAGKTLQLRDLSDNAIKNLRIDFVEIFDEKLNPSGEMYPPNWKATEDQPYPDNAFALRHRPAGPEFTISHGGTITAEVAKVESWILADPNDPDLSLRRFTPRDRRGYIYPRRRDGSQDQLDIPRWIKLDVLNIKRTLRSGGMISVAKFSDETLAGQRD